jgi:hypothetical protein
VFLGRFFDLSPVLCVVVFVGPFEVGEVVVEFVAVLVVCLEVFWMVAWWFKGVVKEDMAIDEEVVGFAVLSDEDVLVA